MTAVAAIQDLLAAARAEFDPEPGTVYLDAATYGLPPRATVEAVELALLRWQEGSADWIEEWDRVAERCRALFAGLIGSSPEEIALVPTVSAGVGQVAASLPEGTEVIVPGDEFTSVLFPFLAAEGGRGARVREAPLREVADAIGPETGLVAFSLVRSQSGEVAPLADIVEAAGRHGARVLVDATHALPFIEPGPHLAGIDYLVCHGYKHLLCPRGAGFMHVRREAQDGLVPYLANWRAATPIYGRTYGGSLDLPETAARFDVSLAWHAWAGALPSLEALTTWRRQGLMAEPPRLATRLATALGAEPTGSSFLSVPVADSERAAAALGQAGIRCAARGGRVRLSAHLWNTDEDIDRAAGELERFVG